MTARFRGRLLASKGVLDWGRLPPDFGEVLWASFRRATKGVIKKTGASRTDIAKRLPALVHGLHTNLDGTLSLNTFYTKTEFRIIHTLADNLVAQPAFDDERLFVDFSATLKSHGLLLKPELREFANLKPTIGLFAASLMHNCTIRLTDETPITLGINTGNNHDEKISVSAGIDISDEAFRKHTNTKALSLASAVFVTNVEASAGCKPELLAVSLPWDFYIELTPDRLLGKLG